MNSAPPEPLELLQIVPKLPPAISGVGDYALLLARELAASQNVRTQFLNADLAWQGSAASVAPFKAGMITKRSIAALGRALERNPPARPVLLHYVGYGYAKRGCPFWLVRALEEWKRKSRSKLIVLFHELSATGPVWTSSFWTSGLQSWLAARLARLADARFITTEIKARRLRRMSASGTPVRTLAVFSTLGEPAVLVPYRQRQRQMIVFGGGGWRREVYTRYQPEFAEACRRLQIERVIDIGSPIDIPATLPVPMLQAGVLPAREASELMNHSTAGFLSYPIPHVGKSTIFAAYCAHGMTPVTVAANHAQGDGLRANEHFLAGTDALGSDGSLAETVANRAHSWYRGHRLAIHAQEIRQSLSPS